MRSQPATPVGGFQVLRNFSLKIQADGFDSVLLEFQCNFSPWDLEASKETKWISPHSKTSWWQSSTGSATRSGHFATGTKQLWNSSTEIFA